MDFIQLYNKYHRYIVGCDIKKFVDIVKLMFGTSLNIIIAATPKKSQDKLILKIFPREVNSNLINQYDLDEVEIKFYTYLTKRYLLTKRTPHIVGIYNQQRCTQLHTFLKSLVPQCPSTNERLSNKLKFDYDEKRICELLLKNQLKIIPDEFNLTMIEHCELDLEDWITQQLNDIKINALSIDKFISDLQRILFQVIFTQAIIKKDHPGYQHGDLIGINILLVFENSYKSNEYASYSYEDRIFYLPMNGPIAKINDFGRSVIADPKDPIESKSFDKKYDKLEHYNPFNKKTDMYNLFMDLYLGENSLMYQVHLLGLSEKIYESCMDLILEFLDVDAVHKAANNDGNLFQHQVQIDGIPILESTVKSPDKYLKSSIFDSYRKEPDSVVMRFNVSAES